MIDWPATIVAVTGLLTPLGGGIAFVWHQVSKRFDKIEIELAACRRRERREREHRLVHLTVVELLWQETARLSAADNPVLRRAKHLLTDLRASLPLEPDLPDDMAELVARLDTGDLS